MERKIRLDLDALSVETFHTSRADAQARGTVRAREGDCTCLNTCLCRTAAYYCATVQATVVSCDYTNNVSCAYDTYTTCESAGEICVDTSP